MEIEGNKMLDFDESLFLEGYEVTLLTTKASGNFPVVVENFEGELIRCNLQGETERGSGRGSLVNGNVRYFFIDLKNFPFSTYFSTLHNNKFANSFEARKYGESMSNTHVLIIKKVGDVVSSEIIEIPKPQPEPEQIPEIGILPNPPESEET